MSWKIRKYVCRWNQDTFKMHGHSVLCFILQVESNTSSPMEWPYPPAYCTVLHFFSITAVSASIFSMCILAWLRFMGTTYPFFFHGSLLSTKTFGYSTILGAWTCAVALAMPHTVFVREIIVNTTVNIGMWSTHSRSFKVIVNCLWEYPITKKQHQRKSWSQLI